eukprot:CAMPEP_0179050292 /NCGR_PEP_ID=MMETSP0796-20121207/20649_1 /TAXON_ID=73915 /ORGANISM="Pyrodinium bahamense, Strain pbaha01" /LENGTH=70 /DNA_ID=CAMNT_0020746787 /DNA_START=76 /DNA_END=285 /DNA_ORIENTATION=+
MSRFLSCSLALLAAPAAAYVAPPQGHTPVQRTAKDRTLAAPLDPAEESNGQAAGAFGVLTATFSVGAVLG